MGKISYKNKKRTITISNSISYPESVNEQKYRMILSGSVDCLLPVFMQKKRNNVLLECTVENLMPLSVCFQGVITKQMFLDIVMKIIEIIKMCQKNNFDYQNLELKKDCIFIDVLNRRVKCIYWPIVSNQRDISLSDFFKEFPLSLTFNPFEDNSYLNEYKSFFFSLEPFSLIKFEKMIAALSGKEIAKAHISPFERDAEIKNEVVIKNQEFNKKIVFNPFDMVDKPYDSDAEDINGFIADNDKTYNFASPERLNHLNKMQTDAAPVVSNTIITVLTKTQTGERFFVNKPVFTIGKQSCDLCILTSSYISREHAKIIQRNDKYYLVDCMSTNKTYLSGSPIYPNVEYEIFNGTAIKFADEEYIFTVERQIN